MLDLRLDASRDRRLAGQAAPVAGAVALVTLAVWAACLGGPYHFDDHVTPLDDPASQSLGAWVTHLPATLRPVTKLTYAVEATAGLDASPAARRAVSVLIHSAGAALLFLLLLELAAGPGGSGAGGGAASPGRGGEGGALAGAALLALVWALHPVHAESLLAVAGRTAALSGALVLGALLAHARGRVGGAAVLLCLAALARETALLAAGALVCLELATARRPWREHLRRLAPVAVGAAVALVWVLATPRYRQLADFSLMGRPWLASLAQQVAAVPVGLSLYLRPWALAVDHGVPLPTTLASPLFAAGAALLVGAAAGGVAARRLAPPVAVGLTLWLAALLPTQSVIPKLDPLTERPLGLALAGLVLAVAGLAHTRRWPSWAGRAGLVLGVVAVGLVATATVARGRLYRSEIALWGAAARRSTASARPHLNYARALIAAGCLDAARGPVEHALRIAPWDPAGAALRARLDQSRASGARDPDVAARCPPASTPR